jgi:hypothetical protein
MTFVRLVVGAIVLGAAALVVAQEAPVRVWGVRVPATDVEAPRGVLCEDLRPVENRASGELGDTKG